VWASVKCTTCTFLRAFRGIPNGQRHSQQQSDLSLTTEQSCWNAKSIAEKNVIVTNRSESVGIGGVLEQSFDGINFTLLSRLVQRCVAELNNKKHQTTSLFILPAVEVFSSPSWASIPQALPVSFAILFSFPFFSFPHVPFISLPHFFLQRFFPKSRQRFGSAVSAQWNLSRSPPAVDF